MAKFNEIALDLVYLPFTILTSVFFGVRYIIKEIKYIYKHKKLITK